MTLFFWQSMRIRIVPSKKKKMRIRIRIRIVSRNSGQRDSTGIGFEICPWYLSNKNKKYEPNHELLMEGKIFSNVKRANPIATFNDVFI